MREALAAKVRAHAEDDVDFPMPVSGYTGVIMRTRCQVRRCAEAEGSGWRASGAGGAQKAGQCALFSLERFKLGLESLECESAAAR